LTEAEDRDRSNRFDIDRLTARLVGATDWLCDRPETADASLGYFGSSTGAAAALRGAARRNDVDTLVDLDPSTLCFAHFGPVARGDLLERYRGRLREWVGAIERVRAELGDDEAVVDHFVEAQKMDGVWGERKARSETAMNVRGVLTALDGRD